MERHLHAEGHAYAGADALDAHASGKHAPGKQTHAELEPAGPLARGSSSSLFAGGLPWDSDHDHDSEHDGEHDSEHDSDEDIQADDDVLALAARSAHGR